MIGKEEAREVVSSLKAAIINEKFEDAIAQLKTVYDQYFCGVDENVKTINMQQFMAHIREYFGYTRHPSLLGISAAEYMYQGLEKSSDPEKKAKFSDISTVLSLGKAILAGNGDPQLAITILERKFAPASSTPRAAKVLTLG